MAGEKNKVERVIEVFPTTNQLVVFFVFSLLVLGGLVGLEFKSLPREGEAPDDEPVAARYFNSMTLSELSAFEDAAESQERAGGRVGARAEISPEDVMRVKLKRAIELTHTKTIAQSYTALSPPERDFILEALSDFKLALLLGELGAAESQEVITRMIELSGVREEAAPESEEAQGETSSADNTED